MRSLISLCLLPIFILYANGLYFLCRGDKKQIYALRLTFGLSTGQKHPTNNIQEGSMSFNDCEESCKTSYRTESYQSTYYIKCGIFGWSRCTRYRISYKRVSYLYCDGGWSSWSSIYWSTSCSATCDAGIQYGQRRRTCTNPSPRNGGKPCSGSSTLKVTRACKVTNCTIDGGWSSWSAIYWSTSCSATCDEGTQNGKRTRTCTNPSPANGGKPCPGSSTLNVTRACKVRDCPIDGGWSNWSAISWTVGCSTTCGVGIQNGVRTRTCTNPSPANGGKLCLGSSTLQITRTCKDRDCPPVNGDWSDYTAVSWNDDCSTTCKGDYGIESGYKNRTCTNPEPAYGGKDCVGESFAIDTRQCTLKECPVDGGWGNYSLVQWSGECSTTCGFGTESGVKTRTCSNPKPAYGGEDCVGETNSTETRQCKLKDCSNNNLTITCDHNGQYIPHPTNCHKFYQCVWFTPVEMDCPNNLAWNGIILNCDYMENVPLCNQLGSTGDSSTDNTNTNTTGFQSEFECGDQTGFFADPKNCTTFYQCVHGQKYHMSCAAGTYFSGGVCMTGEC